MRLKTMLGAAALAVAIPAIAAAQTAAGSTGAASSTDQTAGASAATAPATGAVAGAAAITAGLPVKDKTGAAIGQVTDVKADASGKQVATIKMGADTFAVDTSSLAVDNGAATINATQAEIKAMLPKKK
jgi:hypothetical protein